MYDDLEIHNSETQQILPFCVGNFGNTTRRWFVVVLINVQPAKSVRQWECCRKLAIKTDCILSSALRDLRWNIIYSSTSLRVFHKSNTQISLLQRHNHELPRARGPRFRWIRAEQLGAMFARYSQYKSNRVGVDFDIHLPAAEMVARTNLFHADTTSRVHWLAA